MWIVEFVECRPKCRVQLMREALSHPDTLKVSTLEASTEPFEMQIFPNDPQGSSHLISSYCVLMDEHEARNESLFDSG